MALSGGKLLCDNRDLFNKIESLDNYLTPYH